MRRIPCQTSTSSRRCAISNALSEAAKGFPDLAKADAAGIVAALQKLESDPGLLAALQRRVFIEKGWISSRALHAPSATSRGKWCPDLLNHYKGVVSRKVDRMELFITYAHEDLVKVRELAELLALVCTGAVYWAA